MIGEALDRLLTELGKLTAEQGVHAAAARRLAALMDGEAPAYALPAVARELRAAVDALTGAPSLGQGATSDELSALLRDL